MRLVVDKVNYGSSLFPANYKGLADKGRLYAILSKNNKKY